MSATLVKACLAPLQICTNPVFIIGSPRSGTSILAWSLAQHSELWTSGEMHILFGLFGVPSFTQRLEKERRFPQGWFQKESVDKDEFLGFLGMGLNALFASRSRGKRWIEQTPVNTLMVDVLAAMFPGAMFLHILRDGQQVVNSMTNFANALGESERTGVEEIGFYPPWAKDFRTACITWQQSVSCAKQFVARQPSRSLTIRYERLVAEPETSFAEMFAFLGLRYEESSVMFFRSNKLHSSYRPPPVERDHKRQISTWNDWNLEQRRIFVEECGSTYIACGYANEEDLIVLNYGKLIADIRTIVASALPCGSKVIVASKGDNALLDLDGCNAQHFPQDDSGSYAGHHPADSEEAVAHLEALRARGVDYLLIPETSLWWLDHYTGFREHLDARYRRLPTQPICAIFHLSRPSRADPQSNTDCDRS